jgi:hypothetical protein
MVASEPQGGSMGPWDTWLFYVAGGSPKGLLGDWPQNPGEVHTMGDRFLSSSNQPTYDKV